MSIEETFIRGQYFDGRHPVGSAATLILAGHEAALIGMQICEKFDARQLRVSPRVGKAGRFIALSDGGQFYCADDPLLDRLQQESRSEGVVSWLEARAGVAVAGVAIVASILLAGYFVGLPVAAERVVSHIPVDTERALGDQVLAWLDNNRWFNPTRLDAEQQSRIRRGFGELRRGLPLESHYRLEFRDSPFIGPNAFALPGGAIVITDSMVKKAESLEEVEAVLAHEIGHVKLRHSMRHLLQDSVVAVVAATITADAASLSVAVAGLPTFLAQAKYSREFEAEADDFAFRLLKDRGRSPEAFANLMERLQGKDGEAERSFSFLSTHPVTADRVQRARAAGQR